MVLHGKGRVIGELQAAIRAVEQRAMRFPRILRQACGIDRKTVVHGDDLDLKRIYHPQNLQER